MTQNNGWTYKPVFPEVWKANSKFITHCPLCRVPRTHKSLALANDRGNNLCAKCKIERGNDYWAMLRLIRKEEATQRKEITL